MTRRLTAIVLLVAVLALPTLRAEDKPNTARAAFERMKKLAGDWTKGEDKDKVFISTKVISAGSVIVETMMPGQPHEMITVYFMDGEDLVATHYCGSKNQPRMKAIAPFDGKTIQFRFDGGTNVNPDKDKYMGDLDLTIVSDDEVKQSWTSYNARKKDANQMPAFELKRKK